MQAKRIMRLMAVVAVVLAVIFAVGYHVRISSKATPTTTGTWTVVTVGDMVLIPSGTFAMGNCNGPVSPRLSKRIEALRKGKPQPWVIDDETAELPVHTVMVSAFYMDKHEVTQQTWDRIFNWATNHGYAFDNPGEGMAPNHPVYDVSWYDCVKWCNARSEHEGLRPCYYTSTNFIMADIHRTGSNDLQNCWVFWAANGYRLPTEAEWEKAARGGVVLGLV